MKFYFQEEAEAEFEQAVGFYEGRRPGLGLDFAKEVYAAISRIAEFPDAWQPVSKNTRRCLVHRFPYGVVYRIRDGYIQIMAVADLRRAPGYWRCRE